MIYQIKHVVRNQEAIVEVVADHVPIRVTGLGAQHEVERRKAVDPRELETVRGIRNAGR